MLVVLLGLSLVSCTESNLEELRDSNKTVSRTGEEDEKVKPDDD